MQAQHSLGAVLEATWAMGIEEVLEAMISVPGSASSSSAKSLPLRCWSSVIASMAIAHSPNAERSV